MDQPATTDDETLEVGRRLRDWQIAAILDEFKKLRQRGFGIVAACEVIGPKYRRTGEGIRWIVNRFRPSNGAAQDYIRGNALRLAMRVVRKANVDQAIDILSRPNVGVLDPAKGSGSDSGGGFFLSVTADTCGAVKVGLASGQGAQHAVQAWNQPQLEGASGPQSADAFNEEATLDPGTAGAALREEVAAVQRADVETPQRLLKTGRGTGHTKQLRDAISASKQRLAAARERAETAQIARKTRQLRNQLNKPVDAPPNSR